VPRDRGRQALKAVRLARAGQTNAPALLAGLCSYLSEEEKEALVPLASRTGLETAYRHFGNPYESITDRDQLSRQLTRNHFEVGLPSDMLRKVDMMSMRAGIEVRVPLLDEELVAFALSLPHRMKTDGRKGKLVLRDVAAKWLPAQVASHPKHGFTIPLDVMVQPRFHDALADLLSGPGSRTRAFLRRELVERWLHQFRCGTQAGGAVSREGLYLRVFMLLALELWLREQRLTW
jgi:asparagine synthase (glutamine-hydrolysing)